MNQKQHAKIAGKFLAAVLVAMAGYFVLNNLPRINNPAVTYRTPTRYFDVFLPKGWAFNKLQGVDSYIGEFLGDGARLGFDYGWYSGSLAGGNDRKHIVTYETIDGHHAKIVVPSVTGNGTTGVFFPDARGIISTWLDDRMRAQKSQAGTRLDGMQDRLTIAGRNLTASQQATALKIFRTLKFQF